MKRILEYTINEEYTGLSFEKFLLEKSYTANTITKLKKIEKKHTFKW